MSIAFILNRDTVACDWAPGSILLDFLREGAGLTAAKPGCREGDCGACAVLQGERSSVGQVVYRVVNACLTPLAAVAGTHVLTVEGLGESLTPVQQALVEEGGVQCGYCTPGMVVALTAHLLASPSLDGDHLLAALDGNLCRCTGYMGIKRAGECLHERLGGLLAEPAARIPALMAAGVLPDWLAEIPERLAALPVPEEPKEPEADEPVLAGGTDLLLRHPAELAGHALWLAGRRPELQGIQTGNGRVKLGAAVTLQTLLESEDLAQALPEIRRALVHVASMPVRDRATIGGNLVNASPIGDLSVLLLALGAEVQLVHHERERRLPLAEFFLGYKKLALEEGELLVAVEFALPASGSRAGGSPCSPRPFSAEGPGERTGGLHFEKVAHRDHLDIASVNCALSLELDGHSVVQVCLAAGGVAPIPLRLRSVEAMLAGQQLTPELAVAAARRGAADVSPLSDVHGSAAYKRLLLRQLVLACLLELAPFLEASAVLETL